MLEMLRRVKNVKDIGKLIFPKLSHWSINLLVYYMF